MSTKNDWANVGKDFKKLGTDLGKTFVKTIKKGAQKVEDWAMDGDNAGTASSQAPVAEATVVEDSDK